MRNEVYELKLIDLETSLGTGKDPINATLSLVVILPGGAVLFIDRTTPIFWDNTMSPD